MGRNMSVLGRMIGVVFVWFYLATGVCITIGLILNAMFHPGIAADLSVAGSLPHQAGLHINLTQFLLDLIPTNVVAAMPNRKYCRY